MYFNEYVLANNIIFQYDIDVGIFLIILISVSKYKYGKYQDIGMEWGLGMIMSED